MEKHLPRDWRMVRLGELCELFVDGDWIESKDQSESGIQLIQTGNVGVRKFVDKNAKKFVTQNTFEKLNCTEVFPGDILISRLPDPVGRSCIVPKLDHRCITAVDCTIARVNKGVSNNSYLNFALNSRQILDEINKHLTGTTRKRISRTNLGRIKIPLPPLPVQHKIVEILEEADNLRKLRQKADEKMKDLIPSLFVQMFGDPTTNPKRWPLFPISELCEGKYGIKAGPFGSSLKKNSYTTSGYRVYGQEQVISGDFSFGNYYVSKEKFKLMIAYQVKPGDLLISLVGTIGKVVIVPKYIEPGIINPRLLKITPKNEVLNSVFLAELIQHPSTQSSLNNVAHGGTMGVLNAGLLKKLSIPLPPLPLQQEFAGRVKEIEEEKERQVEGKKKLDDLFNSLMQRAFTGELVV